MNIPIFTCSNSTIDEVFKRRLFGDKGNRKKISHLLTKGNTILLYNTSGRMMYGPFIILNVGDDLEPTAWGSRFPYQVKVDFNSEDLFELSFEEIKDIINFHPRDGINFVPYFIGVMELSQLLEISHNLTNIDKTENKFREEYPAKLRCDDGHFVRSRGEQLIDNWLYYHGILHAYERKIPIEEQIYCDFFLPQVREEGVYVEYWGLEGEQEYENRKAQKLNIYNKHNLRLISISNRDLDNIDDVLSSRLKQDGFNLI